MKKDLVFIASGGRTGTTFFGERLMTVIDDCWSEHTPDMWAGFSDLSLSRIRKFGLWHMTAGRLLGRTGMRPLGQKCLSGKLSKDYCLDYLRDVRNRYHDSISETLIIESYSRWWMFADCIHTVWPDAKLIGIIRDPREWITSWQRHQPRRHTAQYLGWFPLGPLTPEDTGDKAWISRWRDLDQFGRLAWDWRTLYGKIDSAAEANHRARIFRFEDLFGPDGGAIAEMAAFSADHGERQYHIRDLDGFTDKIRNASKGPRSSWRDWPARNALLVDELCGPLMRKYGYGLEPEWQAKLHEENTPQPSVSPLYAVA